MIQKIRQGTSAAANWRTINELIEVVNALGIQTNGTRRGLVELRSRPRDVSGSGSDAQILWAELQADHVITNDYLVVKIATWNRTTSLWESSGLDIQVALPYGLRFADRPTAQHAIRDPYVADDIILISYQTGATGVESDPAGSNLVYVDLNISARSWAVQVPVCIAGNTESYWFKIGS